VITKAARAGLGNNRVLVEAISRAKQKNAAVHLMGICSDAGVHGLLRHLFAIIDVAKELAAPKVYLHLFTDGRDTGPFLGKGFIGQVEAKCREAGVGQIASVIGRYYSMDRDNRWEWVHKAFAALTGYRWHETGVAISASPQDAAQHYYDHPRSETQHGDEFVPPTM